MTRVIRPGGRLRVIDVDMGRTRREWWWRKPWHIASAPLVLLTEGRNPLRNRTSRRDLDRLPLTRLPRPDWDAAELERLGMTPVHRETIARRSVGWLKYAKYGCWGDYVSVTGMKP